MRILVAGATGYIGSRLVPELLRRGHDVVAASSSPPAPVRFLWGARVVWRRMDATDARQVARAAEGCDAMCYLVHSLDRDRFAHRDRAAAAAVRDAVTELGLPRVVYLSGLVPEVPREELSPHLASRLEVEEILATGSPATLSLRAGMVVGAGSTSYEIMRQTAESLLLRPVPSWLRSRVQPVAVADVVMVLARNLEEPSLCGRADLGGPDVLTYPELVDLYCEVAGLRRVQVTVPTLETAREPAGRAGLGSALGAAVGAGLVSAAPYRTANALLQSLRHDMVCDPAWQVPDAGVPFLSVREALRAAAHEADWPAARETSDPAWVQQPSWDGRIGGLPVPFRTSARAATHVVEHRLRGLLSAAPRGGTSRARSAGARGSTAGSTVDRG